MPKLNKRQLLERVENGIKESGWNLLFVTDPSEHPARYQVYREHFSHAVRVYIWNLTHGGGRARPVDEYRIQVTGVPQFEPEIGGKTLILGWWDDVGVFAGFDYQHHKNPLGYSPSMQIREAALRNAVVNGLCPHQRGGDEIAIAFRPDFIGAYIDNLESLHQSGQVAGDVEILSRIGNEPERVSDEEINSRATEKRKFAFVSTKRALRDISFRARVLNAYSQKCAFCGLQLKLLDGAHILPVSQQGSTDETCNGVALCATHHRAYDHGLITFDPEYRVHMNRKRVEEFRETGHDGGLDEFVEKLKPILILPPDRRDRPNSDYVGRANTVRGWDFL